MGLVFAKLSIPKNRAKTVVFSKNAVICERNKKLCMIFRIGDMRHDSFIVNASISVKIIRRRVSDEGEMYHQVEPIKIKPDSAEEPCVFMIWPITVLHVIDQDSPFYNCSAADLANERFELHVVLEGVTESTSMTFQARTSYLPREILWGHRFESMMIYRRDNNKYQVNFSAFHSTYEVDTPLCSSNDLEDYYKTTGLQHQHQHFASTYFWSTLLSVCLNNLFTDVNHSLNVNHCSSSSPSMVEDGQAVMQEQEEAVEVEIEEENNQS